MVADPPKQANRVTELLRVEIEASALKSIIFLTLERGIARAEHCRI